MALSTKGMDVNPLNLVIGLALLLLVAAVLIVGIMNSSSTASTVFTSVTTCTDPSGVAGECLGPHCDNRPGWVSVGQYTCKDGQDCCILTSPQDWFTSGSVILSYNGHDYKLKPGDTIPVSGTIPDAKTFLLSYVPHTAANANDKICSLKVGEKVIYSTPQNTICADTVGGPLNVVTLYSGTGQDFAKQVNGQTKGEYAITVTADGSPAVNFNANIKIG